MRFKGIKLCPLGMSLCQGAGAGPGLGPQFSVRGGETLHRVARPSWASVRSRSSTPVCLSLRRAPGRQAAGARYVTAGLGAPGAVEAALLLHTHAGHPHGAHKAQGCDGLAGGRKPGRAGATGQVTQACRPEPGPTPVGRL